MSLDNDIKNILGKFRTVAVVGLSKDPSKYSYEVAQFLQAKGWRIVPVNPFVDEVLGEKAYKSLLELPEDLQKAIEVVDIFRRPEDIPPIVDQAVQLRQKIGRPYVIWMQLGIVNEEAAAKARQEGLTVIMDRCMLIETKRLESERELEKLRAKKLEDLKAQVSQKKVIANQPIVLDDANFDEIVQSHQLMIIDCWAVWCVPCKVIEPVVEELARDYAGRVTVAKLNVDENPLTASRFGVQSIPTLLIVKDGKEVDRIIGAVSKQYVEERIKRHL